MPYSYNTITYFNKIKITLPFFGTLSLKPTSTPTPNSNPNHIHLLICKSVLKGPCSQYELHAVDISACSVNMRTPHPISVRPN